VSTIEQAAKRLEALRRAGIDVPAPDSRVSRSTTGTDNDRTVVTERPLRGVDPREATGDAAEPSLPKGSIESHSPARHAKEVKIDLARLAAAGLVTPEAPRSQLADEFRVIKRPLLDNAHGNSAAPVSRANLIFVTSGLPGEGKTFTAINLAMSIAMEMDHTVLLADADVARPSLLGVLGLPPSAGLMDMLTNPGIALSDVLLRTNVPKLTILPAGMHHSRATELLASQGMVSLVCELATRYSDRVIVFDGPPLLPTTESRVLASHMGQVVVVVEADNTTHGTVRNALAMLEACPVVMTILNKAAQSDVGSYYGYYGDDRAA
jgi:protein-tyrosine kinase